MRVRFLHGPLTGRTDEVADPTYAEVLCQSGYAEPVAEAPEPGPEVAVPTSPEPARVDTSDETDADTDL